MASTSRSRRPAERRKERKGSKGKDTGVLRTWLHEFLSVFFFSLSIFILLSFFSNEMVVGYASSTGHRFSNLMGPVGHLTGTMLTGLMGWCTLVPAAWAAWLSFFFWNFEENSLDLEVKSKVVVCSGLAGMLVFSCAIAEIFVASGAGGTIGSFVAHPLVMMFSTFGASLLCVAFFVLSVALATQISIAGIIGGVLSHGLQVGRLVLVTAPALFFKGFRRFGDFLVGIRPKRAEIGTLGFVKDRRAKPGVLEDPQEVLPKPRLRRNSIDAVLKEDPSAAKDTQPEPPPRDVVVNRPVALASTEKGGQVRRVIKKPKAAKVADVVAAPYERPDLSLLTRGEAAVESEDDEELRQKSMQIEAKLKDFGILGRVTHIHPGPVITLFEFEPAPGVKVGRIAALQDDLAMGLRASSIRIIAPIPKRGTVGIEVPNRHRDLVRLRDVLESDACANADSILSVPIGKDTSGEAVVADISTMPHLLMAGATGTGKSVSINAFIISFLYRADPSELGLILIDPKILELSAYEGIPHLRVPVVTHPKQARAVLQWAINEMERRYRLLQRFSVRNIDGYNRIVAGDAESEGLIKEPGQDEVTPGLIPLKENDIVEGGTVDPDEVMTGPLDPQELLIAEELKPLPKIVIVIDELADLMLTVGRDIEELITRLAQKARASGIHLILATQRPSVDVITGLIKANFPARLSFRVTSKIDSRTILDSGGAEKLLGRGDMLLMQPGADGLRRVHGAFVSDAEVKKVVAAVKKGGTPRYDEHIMHLCEKALAEDDGENSSGVTSDGTIDPSEYDSFYDKAVELVVEKGQASTSMIQRTFRIGYNRAARIIEMMEREGVIGPMDGVKPRQVIVPTHDQE